MSEQKPMTRWGIFCTNRDRKVADQFSQTMKQCFQQVNYEADAPRIFEVNSPRVEDWMKELKSNLNPQVQAVVLILPGQKGKAPLYDKLKMMLVTEVPVPSQVVLSGTISKGKNLRSIVAKILVQINAKIGGEPWCVDQLPFMDKPTMIVGFDVFQKVGKFSILAFVGSNNKNGTKYYSKCA